jgi:hypothetical protein
MELECEETESLAEVMVKYRGCLELGYFEEFGRDVYGMVGLSLT